jgi:hypothetical protein
VLQGRPTRNRSCDHGLREKRRISKMVSIRLIMFTLVVRTLGVIPVSRTGGTQLFRRNIIYLQLSSTSYPVVPQYHVAFLLPLSTHPTAGCLNQVDPVTNKTPSYWSISRENSSIPTTLPQHWAEAPKALHICPCRVGCLRLGGCRISWCQVAATSLTLNARSWPWKPIQMCLSLNGKR